MTNDMTWRRHPQQPSAVRVQASNYQNKGVGEIAGVRPTTFHGACTKSPKATMPTTVMTIFFADPMTLVVKAQFARVHTMVA